VIFDPRKDDVVKKAQDLTGGEGVDIMFDCAEVAMGLETACKAIKVKGTVVNAAIWEETAPFQVGDLRTQTSLFKCVTSCLHSLDKSPAKFHWKMLSRMELENWLKKRRSTSRF